MRFHDQGLYNDVLVHTEHLGHLSRPAVLGVIIEMGGKGNACSPERPDRGCHWHVLIFHRNTVMGITKTKNPPFVCAGLLF
jgi:hypothetical protein